MLARSVFGRRRCGNRPSGVLAAAAALLVLHAAAAGAQDGPAAVQSAGEASLFRIFLRDGGALVSYGEFARVADRVVLSVPLGGESAAPVLHLVSIPDRDVDWERTNAYAESVRARRYAETQGEADFATLSREVAATLNQVSFVADPLQQLALVESARRQLIEWPQRHYGYRGDEVGRMTAWLDQIVMQFRAAAGQSDFDLALIARAPTTMTFVGLLPAPAEQEQMELGLEAARRTPDPVERVSLLRAILAALPPSSQAGWVEALRARASSALDGEVRVDRAYGDLVQRTLLRAGAYARAGNVRGLEALGRRVLAEDERLNRARPAEIAALMATLDLRLDAARRLRLARDAWAVRLPLLRAYWQDVRQGLDRLLGVRAWLTDIRQLAGPAPRSVQRLAYVAELAELELARVKAPPELAAAHGTLRTASTLARRAAASRLDAVRTASMATAWEASSAAAGSLMLVQQGISELRRLTNPPTLDLP